MTLSSGKRSEYSSKINSCISIILGMEFKIAPTGISEIYCGIRGSKLSSRTLTFMVDTKKTVVNMKTGSSSTAGELLFFLIVFCFVF